MTPIQQKFVLLEKKKEEIKKYYEELNLALDELKNEIGIGGYFQDSELTVYKVINTKGKYIPFHPVDYVRTRRLSEKSGDLSIKEAESAGFKVPSK